MTPDEIAQQLHATGWPADVVQQAFLAVQASSIPTAMQQPVAPVTSQPAVLPQANGTRRGRIRTSFILLRVSMDILKGNKYLLRYFLMTWLSVILVNLVIFACIVIAFASLAGDSPRTYSQLEVYSFVFVSYLVIYFLVNFYAAALAANLLDIFHGQPQPYKTYISATRKKLVPILVFSLISSIIGMILQFIVERIRWIGWILSWLIGTAWSLGTMFVLPIIMTSDVNALTAIKQSVHFFKQTWGENVVSKVTVALPIFFLNLLVIFIFWPLLAVTASSGHIALFIFVLFLYVFVQLNIAIVGSFASSVVNVALFYYAAYKQIPAGFDADMLNNVLIKRKHKLFKKGDDSPASPIS